MLKKLSRTTNFILIGIIVGFFIGASIQQVLGDTKDVSGTLALNNLIVNMGENGVLPIAGNGLGVDFGNLLVLEGSMGIGILSSVPTPPTVELDIVGEKGKGNDLVRISGDINIAGGITARQFCLRNDGCKTNWGN